MTIAYDLDNDELQILWNENTGDNPQWRMARRNVELLVDDCNETHGICIDRATKWTVADLHLATKSFRRRVSLRLLSDAQEEPEQRGIPLMLHLQAQGELPFDDPLSSCVARTRAQRGICKDCGAIATHRQAPKKLDGWFLGNRCGCRLKRIESPAEQNHDEEIEIEICQPTQPTISQPNYSSWTTTSTSYPTRSDPPSQPAPSTQRGPTSTPSTRPKDTDTASPSRESVASSSSK